MTSGIIRSSRKRDKLYRQSLGRIPDSVEKQKYMRYRNVYNSVKRQAKQFYYANLLQQYGGNVRKTWTVLNELIGRSKHKCAISDIFMIDGSKVEDKARISDEFCKYFSTVGETCADNSPDAIKPYTHYMKGETNMNSMCVRPTDKLEIIKIFQKFKPKVSTGDDGISMQLLKHISNDECSEPLSLLINMSLENGVFPEAMKLEKVVPIYKAKNKQMFTNYRPISLLSIISKIFEKVMHQRLYSFLQQDDILYDGQFGFRPKHSTIDAIT